MTGLIHVLGSLNVDQVVRVEALPLPGQTLRARSVTQGAGGKGANQATAAARAGSPTIMTGVVGADDAGTFMIEALRAEGVDTHRVRQVDNNYTGRAIITVQDSGENAIVVMGGANDSVTAFDAQRAARDFNSGDILLLQLETPLNAAIEAAQLANEAGVTVVLNAAPAAALPDSLTANTDILVVNETELTTLTKIEGEVATNARQLATAGGLAVVVTLGGTGALLARHNTTIVIPAPTVDVVDTTGAGDSFVGYLASELSRGSELNVAVSVAVVAGALTVTRAGAQASIPTEESVRNYRTAINNPAKQGWCQSKNSHNA